MAVLSPTDPKRHMFDMVPKAKALAKRRREEEGEEEKRSMLSPGDMLGTADRWCIKEMIGSGGFGQIYTADDARLVDNSTVVIKVGLRTRTKDTQRMYLEIEVIKQLQDEVHSRHVPKYYGCGFLAEHSPPVNYIVMQMISRNFTEIRRASPLNRLTINTSLRLFVQMLAAINDVHQCQYLHRDVKPSNMAMGLETDNARILYLIDCGLVRRFTDKNGKVRRARHRAAFRGTQRYVSVRVHNREEQCRGDDLVSLFYTLIDLCMGGLPWRTFRDDQLIKGAKQRFDVEMECSVLPPSIMFVWHLIAKLTYEETPNYALYTQLTRQALNENGYSAMDLVEEPFDWEYARWRPVAEERRSDEQ